MTAMNSSPSSQKVGVFSVESPFANFGTPRFGVFSLASGHFERMVLRYSGLSHGPWVQETSAGQRQSQRNCLIRNLRPDLSTFAAMQFDKAVMFHRLEST